MSNVRTLLLPLLGIALAATSIGLAQDAPRPAFDVTSIKPNSGPDNRVGIGLQPGGRFTATNVTLRLIMRQAFRVQDFQIIGGPGWASSDRYDVEAKAPEGQPVTPNQIAPMIESMLVERFKLKVHRETRELPVYELIVAKDGAKLKPSLDASGQPLLSVPLPGGPGGPGGPGPAGFGARGGPGGPPPGLPAPGAPLPPGSMMVGGGEVRAAAIPLTQLATLLSQQLGRTVIDKTGMTGLYDIQLQFTPQPGQNAGPLPPAAGPPGPPPTDFSGPSIFTAVQEQLGLRLESARGPVEVIVIDSVEKPTEN